MKNEIVAAVKATKPATELCQKTSYAEKAKSTAPKIGKTQVQPKADKIVLVYPKDKRSTDSEETKQRVKTLLAPTEDGFQIKDVRKVAKGGIAIEAGNVKSAQAIRDAASKLDKYKCVDVKANNPRVMVYDVDKNTKDDEFIKSLYKQNLEEDGYTMEEVQKVVTVKFNTGRRDKEVNNWVIECPPKIRESLIKRRRVYIEFSSCRVVDYMAIVRCYRCQGYGHITKYCKQT